MSLPRTRLSCGGSMREEASALVPKLLWPAITHPDLEPYEPVDHD